MNEYTDDDEDAAFDAAPGLGSDTINDAGQAQEPPLAPYLALDRLLRYARSEALNQHREKAASLIEAAIVSLRDTTSLSKH